MAQLIPQTINPRKSWKEISAKLKDLHNNISYFDNLYDHLLQETIQNISENTKNDDAKYWYDITKRISAKFYNQKEEKRSGNYQTLSSLFRHINNVMRIEK